MRQLLAPCVAEKAKHQLTDLTPVEFNRIVFAEASCSDFRSACDAFTLDEMLAIAESDAFKSWLPHDRDFLWNGIEAAV